MVAFVPDKCPECGEPPRGTLEVVDAVAEFKTDEDGELVVDEQTGGWTYEGNTEIFWDDQGTKEQDGKPVLICAAGHEWPAEMTDGDLTDL